MNIKILLRGFLPDERDKFLVYFYQNNDREGSLGVLVWFIAEVLYFNKCFLKQCYCYVRSGNIFKRLKQILEHQNFFNNEV